MGRRKLSESVTVTLAYNADGTLDVETTLARIPAAVEALKEAITGVTAEALPEFVADETEKVYSTARGMGFAIKDVVTMAGVLVPGSTLARIEEKDATRYVGTYLRSNSERFECKAGKWFLRK